MSNRNIILALELTTPIDDDRPVFVAGNFCSWYPNVAQFQMKKVDAGKYHFEFPHDFKFDEPIEYNGAEESNRFKQLLFRALIEDQISMSKAASLNNQTLADFRKEHQMAF